MQSPLTAADVPLVKGEGTTGGEGSTAWASEKARERPAPPPTPAGLVSTARQLVDGGGNWAKGSRRQEENLI